MNRRKTNLSLRKTLTTRTFHKWCIWQAQKAKRRKTGLRLEKWEKKTLFHKNYQLQKYFQESINELLKNA